MLFLVDLLFLVPRELAAVRGAVARHLLVDTLLLVLKLGGLAGGQLSALDALGDAILLVLAALSNFVVAVLRGVGIVLVVVDLLGKLVLLPVDLLLLRWRELSAVCRTVRARFAIDRRFFRFEIRSFTGGQLTALHSVRDAVLLIFLALPHRRLRRRCAAGCCWALSLSSC